MKNKELHIFVFDDVAVTDSKLFRAIKNIAKRVVEYFDSFILIILNGVRGFSVDINSPPYELFFSLPLCLSTNPQDV